MRNACDSDSHCGLACDASTCDATSLAMWVERCEPLSSRSRFEVRYEFIPCSSFPAKKKLHTQFLENIVLFQISSTAQLPSRIAKKQFSERHLVGFGGAGKNCKDCTMKQCSLRKHGCGTHAWRKHASLSFKALWNTQYKRCSQLATWPFWEQDVPNMRPGEVQCAHRKHFG